MNKKELISKIAAQLSVDRKVTSDVLDTMEQIVTEQLAQGNQVSFTGFGIFHAAMRKGRAGVNPRNPKERIQIPEVRVAKFRPGKNLKEAVK